MRRAFLATAAGAIVLLVSGLASAKGDLVKIGIKGPGLPHEVRISAMNLDLNYEWGAPARDLNEPFYTVIFYVVFPGESRSYPASPIRYYPAHGALPAVFMLGDGSRSDGYLNWVRYPASLTDRLDEAIGGRAPSSQPKFITSWPKAAADVALLVLGVFAIYLVRRRRFSRSFGPAPEARA